MFAKLYGCDAIILHFSTLVNIFWLFFLIYKARNVILNSEVIILKTVLITGAFGGMGRAAVELYKNSGYRVIALDKRCGEAEEGVIPIVADITDEGSLNSAYERVCEITDRLYAIVHFAGVYMLDSLVEMSEENFKRIFEINLFGAVAVNRRFLPLLSRGSKILMTTSELAPLDPLPFTGIYAITKAALDKYAYSLRMELQLLGITVSVLRAGAVDTGMIDASLLALDGFCERTKLYSCNAERFKRIVNGVEARKIKPAKIAAKTLKIITKSKPRFAYSINRNPLLLILNALPKEFQLWVIRVILKK